LKEILYALIPAGADIRATDLHGETITETARRRGVCRVWEKALIESGCDAKNIIAADLRVGLTYRSIDGTLIKGARQVNHNPEFLCDGCYLQEVYWEMYEAREDEEIDEERDRAYYSEEGNYEDEEWPWNNAWPQWDRRPCERYYRAIQRGYNETAEYYSSDTDDYSIDEEYEDEDNEDEDEEDEKEEIRNEDYKKLCTGAEEQYGSSKIDRNNWSTSAISG
jgi:hypothetical protein